MSTNERVSIPAYKVPINLVYLAVKHNDAFALSNVPHYLVGFIT